MAKKRPSGDGLVRKRADGRWEGRIVVGHKEDGSPIFRSVFAKTQKEVMRKHHSQIEAYRDVELTEASNMTLGEWLDKWLSDYMTLTVRESTLEGYKMITNHYIKPHLGDAKIGSVTTADIQKMYNWLRENGRVNEHYEKGNALSDSVIRATHMMLHQAMDAAVRERLIVKNPTEGTVIPKNNYAPKQILTEEQLERFLEVVKQDPVWADFFYTELTTGLRLGEICALKWQDFEEKTGRLHVHRTAHRRKGGGVRVGATKTETGTRTILLPPSTVEVLKARKKKSYSDWIFHNPVVPEVPMDPSTAYHRLKTLLRYAELPSIRFHDLRHTFATHALTSGVDAKTLSTILGHTNASFTLDTYTHMTTDMHRKAVNVVGGFLDEIMRGGAMARRRKQGTGTLRKRTDGRWEGRVVTGYDEKGLPKTKSVLAKTKQECQEKLKVLQMEYVPPIQKCQPDMLFGDWMAFWYETYCKPQLSIRTQVGYEERIYKHIIPEIGKIPLDILTQNDLQQFYTRLKTSGRLKNVEQFGPGLSDRMVRVCHANCSAALKRAVQEGLIRFNPAAGCKLPPKKSGEMQILTQEEMQRFLIQAKQDGYYELFLLELGTGLRMGEILGSDLDFTTGELRITKSVTILNKELVITEPKTKSSIRSIILPPSLLKVLGEYKKTVDSRWMFPSPVKEDAPLVSSYVLRRMKQTLERAGCKKVRFHDLRHTFATMALEHGMDVKTLSTIIGHVSSATTLDIYSHVTDTMQKQAAVKIDHQIGKTDAPIPEEEQKESTARTAFQPYQPKHRKPGTGGIYQINDHLWEGRYSPRGADGKRISRNVYAKTREECEEKLVVMIEEVKAEIAVEKQRIQQQSQSEIVMQ